MQKITPHLWFDKEAKQAAEFYTSVFGKNSKITHASVIKDTPSGDCDIVSFEIWGYGFQAISAGPYFKLNPSISLMVNFDPSQDKDSKKQIDEIWKKLSDGGTVLMPLQKYPFSEWYGWIQDKFGLSWQLILTNPAGEKRPTIVPSMMFVGDNCGKAEEASNFYMSVFKNARFGKDQTDGKSDLSKRGTIARYGPDQKHDKAESVMFTDFSLQNQWFAAMDSAHDHKFAFNEALSFIVKCDTQEEVDYFWEKLSAVPESEQCGWIKDKYGVSWQIVPTAMDKLMGEGDPEKTKRVTEAFLKMKKFDIKALEDAARG